ncbi:BgTH12-05872 [Blumeria graminis f. sp. triticale]|nr:BgTH12-05872 [Blumeria graminis f. sp. triticale]
MAPESPPAPFDRRRLVGINLETVTDVSSTDYPGHYPGEDHSWNKNIFAQNFHVQFHHNEPIDSSFSLIGIDASVANAFRRIMIAEIPTLAIEYVFMRNNTSIIHDEILAQRLGLVPLKGGKKGLLDFLKWFKMPGEGEEPQAYDYNTVVLELKVECTVNSEANNRETDSLKKYHNAHVYAKDLVFKPYGQQVYEFAGEDAIGTTYPDILIAKLRPGQCIDLQAHAIKGIGSDHAKFCPVATASYRLLPSIEILRPIIGKDAENFAKCFPKGVIELESITREEASQHKSSYKGHEGEMKAVVKDAMRDTVSRECLRYDEFKGKVRLGRVRDHFIFSIESLGQWDSDELFLESVKILRLKCEALKSSLVNLTQ